MILKKRGSPSDGRSPEDLRDELKQLMLKHIESMKQQTFVGLNKTELRQQEEQVQRIREVSADYLAALLERRS